jgi:hypothetical protein
MPHGAGKDRYLSALAPEWFGGSGGTEFQDQKLGIAMQGLSLMASLPVYASVPLALL